MTRRQLPPDLHGSPGPRLSSISSSSSTSSPSKKIIAHRYSSPSSSTSSPTTSSSSSSSSSSSAKNYQKHHHNGDDSNNNNINFVKTPITTTTNITTTGSPSNGKNNDNNNNRKNSSSSNRDSNGSGKPHHHHHFAKHGALTSAHSVSDIMSLRDGPAGRANIPVSRSQSFGGLSLRSNSSVGLPPSTPVLGDTLKRSPRAYSKAHASSSSSSSRALRKTLKVPKVPRPSRALMVFDSVKKGIGSYIQATHEDISELMACESGTSTAQQIKSAERYLKRLEFHLAKIDELHECYLLNQQLREGAKNMARAFNNAHSLHRKDSIANVKYGYKECSQTMCAIEAQLENMLGTFNCSLKGIAGFARLVPGDVFEVVIKHGPQKWKAKGRIEKNNSQRWDNPEFTFKCLVGDILSIKASEVRSFKTVLLGQKNCEVCHPTNPDSSNQGLFSSHPQLMTVSINMNGSLKLSIVITWNPLDAMDESVVYYEPPARPMSGGKRRPYSTINAHHHSMFDSNSDLSSIPDRRLSSPMHGGFQHHHGDDSGIYGSATSLPSHVLQQDSFGRNPHSLSSSPVMHARGGHLLSLTPDIRGGRHHHLHNHHQRPFSMAGLPAADTRSIQSQPAQPTSDFLSASSLASSRPHSTYISPAMTASMSGAIGHRSTSSASSSAAVGSGSNSSSSSLYLGHTVLSTPGAVGAKQSVTEISLSAIPGVMVQQTEQSRYDGSLTVEEALGSLMTTLEDFLGQYPEVQKLEEVLPLIETLVQKPSENSSRSSSMSVSIDCAIEEAFDFLNTEDTLDEVDEEGEEEEEGGVSLNNGDDVSNIDKMIMSPQSTAKTADSGIESIAKRLSEDRQLSSSLSSSPVPPSSGNEEVDKALIFHLGLCDKLLENLGNFGPLKCREFYALHLLQKQAFILEKLLDIARQGPTVDLHAVLSDETQDKSLRELWVQCVEQTALYATPDKVISVLEHKYSAKIADHFEIKPIRVFHCLMSRMLNMPVYVSELHQSGVITVYQFMLLFKDETCLSFLEALAQELRLMDRLSANASDTVIKAILTLREDLPAPSCLKLIAKLLVTGNKEMQQSATSYLKVVQRDKVKRDKVMVVLVEGLEDHITDVRAGCCRGLAIIEAEESIDQLVHVSQSDASSTVRRKAKEALYSMGDTGRKALEDAQLSSQGFQGLQVRKM